MRADKEGSMASGDGNSVSAAWAQVVARELRKAGVDLESALCEAGLEARTINNEDAWIPYTRHAALLEIAARRYCDEVLSRQKRRKPELLQKLERRIAELLPSGQARNKIVATDLGLSERTITRRLSDLDTSFAPARAPSAPPSGVGPAGRRKRFGRAESSRHGQWR